MRRLFLPVVLQIVKVLVLYVTVYGYLQGKHSLRLFDKSNEYTRSQVSPFS